PHLAIIDNRVQRKTSKYKIRYDAKILKCENPPATITDELWTTIKEAIKSGDNHLIIVDGEEDLAVLPSIILAPTDAIILYGQPNEGVVLVKAEKMKQKAENLIREFKEVKADGDQNNR
ncbi:MAG: GTP-dependent dephospho-CoA kinase, partial [Methanobacteriaceae archaeon]|nr:GTP-dependent dephospho-CoA kinase [Methanobacteriaceae archaeon]